MKGKIFEIKRFAVHDGDGIRTTVFFKGCSLKCVWCHNPEGLDRERNLSFFEERCTGCGRCLEKCPGRTIDENGKLHYKRKEKKK